jgi:hypothetical protein
LRWSSSVVEVRGFESLAFSVRERTGVVRRPGRLVEGSG